MKNFEKYKTVNERTAACSAFLVKHNEYADIPYIEVAMRWLELEAESEKPLPCPFCGRDVEIRTKGDYNTWNQAQCTCGYRGSWWSDKDKAISAHNRVAREVQESEKEN